jgi:3',5'-cyclic AMP phosphodiesterase CpdA
LVVLNTADISDPIPGFPYSEGAISQDQLRWLEDQLVEAAGMGQWVIVATHHPSAALLQWCDTDVGPQDFRAFLNRFDNVILHLAGHLHRNRVFDHGGYVEIETGSTLDYPNTGRIIGIRQSADAGQVLISYTTISQKGLSDGLSDLREGALKLAAFDAGMTAARSVAGLATPAPEPTSAADWLTGRPEDREGYVILAKPFGPVAGRN